MLRKNLIFCALIMSSQYQLISAFEGDPVTLETYQEGYNCDCAGIDEEEVAWGNDYYDWRYKEWSDDTSWPGRREDPWTSDLLR